MTDEMTLSEALLAEVRAMLRPAGGMTQTELAELVGMSQARLSKWLGGHKSINLETADRIAAALKLRLVR